MSGMLEEMRRRNVFRVAAAYLVVGWVVLQVAELVVPILQLPDWTITMTFYIGLVGFPFALLFAWAFELTPEGLKRSEDVTPEESIANSTGHTLNRTISGLLAIAVIILLADKFMLGEQAADQAAAETTARAAGDAAGPRSIAVLPFVNMSDDQQQEYFSDGISEELLNGLAKIKELRVAARTSSFAFKGQNQDIKNIGQQLNVDTVLEGSVRKAGPRIRITAQLINVEDGYHLWSETYDRELNDIFAIQDEISRAIVDALKVHLTEGEAIAVQDDVNVEAYNFYLLAQHSLRRRSANALELALKQYQKAIDIDPGYAEAWAGKAAATELLSEGNYGKLPLQDAQRQAQQMLDMAFSLNPDLPEAHAVQALLYMNDERLLEAIEHIDLAIAGKPNDGILYAWKSNALFNLGRYNEGRRTTEKAFEIDPLHQTIRHNLAVRAVFHNEADYARELMTPGSAMAYEIDAWVALQEGNYAARAQLLEKGVTVAESGRDHRLSVQASANWFWMLGDYEHASAYGTPSMHMMYRALIDPEGVLAELAAMPDWQHNSFTREIHGWALVILERCEELLALAAIDPATVAVDGNLEGGGKVPRLTALAWCLQKTGREADAQLLARRVKDYIDFNIRNGHPPIYHNRLAELYLLLGDPDAAVAALRTAVQYNVLNWSDFYYPGYRALESRADYREIRQAVYDHMNAERAKLGIEPLEVASLR